MKCIPMNLKTLFTSTSADKQPVPLDQQIIHDNEAIHAAIVSQLQSAQSEILIAASWFTDQELFDVLEQKILSGTKAEIILADHEDNRRLPFDDLVKNGALVCRVRGAGYGMMHHKFCVIDQTKVLYGSYNWSVNARNNNNESIMVTNDAGTVDKMIKIFNETKDKAAQLAQQLVVAPDDDSAKPKDPIVVKKDTSFADVLDSMIAAEVANFDRGLLRQQGFDRAKSTNGDHQTLPKALDTVYSVFINDIDVIDDKKRRLLSKVEEQRLKATEAARDQSDLGVNQLEAELELKKQQAASAIVANDSTMAIHTEKITINDRKIQSEEDQIRKYDNEINEQKLTFIRPEHRYFELLPLVVFGAILLFYIFIFYSSAAYIMIYSAADAEYNLKTGVVDIPEVFNPYALSDAWEKGPVALLFVLTFVLVPIALAVLSRIARFNYWRDGITWVGIFLVDAVIAYQVASVVHRVMVLRGDTIEKWHFTKIFSDTNFYLVFILGALGLILFKYIYSKFISYFEDRNPDHAALKSKAFIKQQEEAKQQRVESIRQLADDNGALEQQNILLRAENQLLQAEIEETPITVVREKEKASLLFNQKKQHIQQTADIYISHIENDNLPISLHSLKDRINIFLEGWNDFLHQEYSIMKATEMSIMANNSIDLWQENKIITNKIDHRVS